MMTMMPDDKQLSFGDPSFCPGLLEVVHEELELEVVPVPRPATEGVARAVVDPAEQLGQVVRDDELVDLGGRHTTGSGTDVARHHGQLEVGSRQGKVVVPYQSQTISVVSVAFCKHNSMFST